jgi:hypothetical protein
MYKKKYNTGYSAQDYGPQQKEQELVKKSGAVYSVIQKGSFVGMPIINAWRKTSAGLMTAKVAPYHASKNEVKSETGNIYVKMIAEVTLNSQTTIHPVLYSVKTKKIVLQKLSLVISPNGRGFTSTGKRVSGYFGKNFQS